MYPLTTQLHLDRHKVLWKLYSALNPLALWHSFTPQVHRAAFAAHRLESKELTSSYLSKQLSSSRSLAKSVPNYPQHREALFLPCSAPPKASVVPSVPHRRQRHPLGLNRMSRLLEQHGELTAHPCMTAGLSLVLERQILVKSTSPSVNRCCTLGDLLQAVSSPVTPCAKA